MKPAGAAIAAVWFAALGFLPATAADTGSGSASVQALLERMSRALQTLNYEGTFVYLHDGDLDAMHIVHRHDANGTEERLTSLTGVPREVIRKPGNVECILPHKRLIVVDTSRRRNQFPMILTQVPRTAGLAKYYDLVRLGRERTAGRDCEVIALKPKDGYRYGYRLWLDAGTAMLLRSELVDGHGRTLERVMFTNLKLPAKIPAKELEPTIDSSGFTRRTRGSEASAAAADPGFGVRVGDLPPGYAKTVDEVQRLSGMDAPVRHLVFTDGLASLSVFVGPLRAGRDALRGESHMGSVNAYGRVLNGFRITVVGDVPAATVKRVAQTVSVQKKK
jgi:sigma-E factor negative regulatory protein RseB